MLYRQSFAPLVVYSGTPKETATRVRLALALGVPAAAIVAESRAHTTGEEAAFIAERLKARSVRRIVLVTNSRHLARAARLFENAGLAVIPAHADEISDSVTGPEARLALLRVVLQELAARIFYRLTGRM